MKNVTYDDTQWKLVPVEPTERMVVAGFESKPDECFSPLDEWKSFQEMTGCQQSAHVAKLCWAAMLAAAPTLPAVGQAQQDVDKVDAETVRVAVARAICVADGADPDEVIWQGNPPEPYGDVLGEYLGHADAAINAIDAARATKEPNHG